jgi:hypothetical protein
MPMTVRRRIDVTQTCIRKGKRRDAGGCIVALATRNTFPGNSITVGCGTVDVFGPKSFVASLPKYVNRLITDFDRGLIRRNDIKPFSFYIRAPLGA